MWKTVDGKGVMEEYQQLWSISAVRVSENEKEPAEGMEKEWRKNESFGRQLSEESILGTQKWLRIIYLAVRRNNVIYIESDKKTRMSLSGFFLFF